MATRQNNPDRLQETVLTTGANSGIGLATAIEVARLGYRSVGSVRSNDKSAVLEAAAKAAGVTVEPVLLDVTDADRCSEVIEHFQPFGLVNNAGYTNTGAVEDVSDDDIRHQLETMTIAPMRLARLAMPAMRTAGRGRIINVSSIFGRTTTPLSGWYQASKHALEAVSDALRVEVASSGVRVVLIEPGSFKTSIWADNETAVGRHDGSRFVDAYDREVRFTKLAEPFMGDPQRVAKVIGKALVTRAPRARYLVGYDAQALAIADRITPTPVRDAIARFGLGL